MPGSNLWPVRIDPSQVDQILANLCVNARDAIGGVGRVTIETANVFHEGEACLVLAVTDNGSGLDEETASHVFEPFFTTKQLGEGTGLGLATVYGIVEQNGGHVSVESELGEGATFRVYLPRFHGEIEIAEVEVPAEMPRGHGETILLVEDEPMLMQLCEVLLSKLGYAVLATGSPKDAMEMARLHASEIRLLMTDVVMPEMNGRELAEAITGLVPGIECLFMSGYTADVMTNCGIDDGGRRFVQKPISIEMLAAKVAEILKGH